MSARPEKPSRRWYFWVGSGVLLLIAAIAAFIGWVLLTESGLRQAARWAERFTGGEVVLVDPTGHLFGPLVIPELRVRTPDMRLTARAITLDWNARALFDRHLDIDALSVQSVEFASRPEEEPAQSGPPAQITLPLSVTARKIDIGRITIHPWAPDPLPQFEMTGLSGALQSDGRLHRVEGLQVMLPFGRAELTGELDGGESPFPLSARGALAGEREGYAYRLGMTASGDLLAPRLAIQAEGAGLAGTADVLAAPFEPVPLRELRAAVGEIDPSAFRPDAPRARLRVEAELRTEPGQQWALTGPIRITNAAPATIDEGGLPFERLAAELRWTPEETSADALALDLPGRGRVSGTLKWQPEASSDAYGRLLADLALEGVRMERLDARLPAGVLSGRVEAAGDAARQTAAVDLGLGRARISGKGELAAAPDPDAPRRFSASGDLAAFDPRAFVPDSPEAEINMGFEASGQLGDELMLDLAWKMRPSRLEGRPLGGEGRLALEGKRIRDADVDMTLAGNRVRATGGWGAPGDEITFDIDAPVLGVLHDELAGRARMQGKVSGSIEEPAGEVLLFAEGLRLPGGLRLSVLSAQARLDAGLDGPFELALGLTGLGRQGEEALLDTAALSVAGRRGAHRIELVATGLEDDQVRATLDGGLAHGASAGAGGASDLRWTGRILSLVTTGRFPVRLTAPTELSLGPQRVTLGQAVFDAGKQGHIRLEQTVWTPEEIAVRGSLTGLAIALGAAEQPSAMRTAEQLVLGAEWDLRLAQSANGELRLYRQSGDLVLNQGVTTRLGLQQLEARVNVRDNRLAASLEARGTQLGTVSGTANARIENSEAEGWRLDPDAALSGAAKLTMPSIAWVGQLLEENIQTGGRIEAAFSISGTPAEPVATGRIRGQGLMLVLVDEGLNLSGGELVADFDRDRLRLTRLEFVSPNRIRPRDPRVPVQAFTAEPGRLSVTGEVALESGAGRFRFRADRMPLLQRVDRWVILSGEGQGRSTWTSLDVTADMRVDTGYIEMAETAAPALSEDVIIITGDEPLPSKKGGFELSADVSIALGDQLYLSALGVDTRLTGTLRLRVRDGEPLQAVGSVATLGGVFRGYGQQLTIERGLVNFQGELDNPGLNVVALRKGLAVEAGIAITGSARRPQIRLVSQPDVPDPDKLSWLVLGRAPQAGGGADLGLLLPAAQALLGKPGGKRGMTDQLSRSLGLDTLSIGQGELGSVTRRDTSRVVGDGSQVTADSTVSGQVLTLGKRLSSDLFLSFEQSLGGAESLVKLTYQLTRRVSLVARSGTDNSADIYYTISFK